MAAVGQGIVIDPRRLAAYINDGGGPIVRDLMRRATNVQAGARRQVGKQTRNTERSIRKVAGQDGRGPFVAVVAGDQTDGGRVAYWHHEGTDPHIIRPRRRKALRWPDASAPGGVRFGRVVHHPGTRPNRYLVDNLGLAGR